MRHVVGFWKLYLTVNVLIERIPCIWMDPGSCFPTFLCPHSTLSILAFISPDSNSVLIWVQHFPHRRGNLWNLTFSVSYASFLYAIFQFHIFYKMMGGYWLYNQIKLHYVYIPHCLYSFTYLWTHWLTPSHRWSE